MSDIDLIVEEIERIEGVDKVLRVGRKAEFIGVYVQELGYCNMVQLSVYHKEELAENAPTLGIKVEDGIKAKAIFNPRGK